MEQKKSFAEFEGIEKEKEVRPGNSKLELLLAGAEMVKSLEEDKYLHNYYEFYNKAYHAVKDNLLSGVEYSEGDMVSLIHTLPYSEEPQDSQLRLGFYTSVLLGILTERNREQGKRTRLVIDGKGKRFDNLFHFLRDFDELLIENIVGDDICQYNYFKGGSGGTLVLRNIVGKKVLTSSQDQSSSDQPKKIRNIALINIKDDNLLSYSDRSLAVEKIICVDNIGAGDFKNIRNFDNAFDMIAWVGNRLCDVPRRLYDYFLNFGLFIGKKDSQTKALFAESLVECDDVRLTNEPNSGFLVNNLGKNDSIRDFSLQASYNECENPFLYAVSRIYSLSGSLRDKSPDEVFSAIDEINILYEGCKREASRK